MKRITTTFFICLLLGITSLHAERDNYTQRTPEKQPEFITGFRYLPPGFECFAVQIQSHRLSWLFNTRYPLFQKIHPPHKRLYSQGDTCPER